MSSTPSRLVLTALAAAAVALLAAPALLPAAPATAAPGREVSAYVPTWADQHAVLATAVASRGLVRTVSPVWWSAFDGGRLQARTGASDADFLATAAQAGIAVEPVVSQAFDAAEAVALLTDPARRRAHADDLVALGSAPGVSGLQLDYENIALAPAADVARLRDGFTALVADLCGRLHAVRRTCSVAVMARTSDAEALWRGRFATGVYDYRALGAAVDRLRIMGYHQHGPTDAPGPVSSPSWYDAVLAYAGGRVPRGRVELVLAAYGHDWPATGRATSRTSAAALELARDRGAVVRWDPVSSSSWFSYTDGAGATRTVWFDSARGLPARLAVADRHGVPAVGLWALGYEDTGTWEALATPRGPRGVVRTVRTVR
ncbi:hypothetical protein NUM3379_37620 [Kineococcus sp. NUM-3379]